MVKKTGGDWMIISTIVIAREREGLAKEALPLA